jgi:chaperone BCS1
MGHGPPGTGKTSFVSALAAKLSLHIYILSLTENDIQDSDIIQFMQSVPARSIVLLKDIDSSASTLNRAASNSNDGQTIGPEKNNSISLAGLLNCFDGIISPDGVIVVMTANDADKLGEALTRPGRVDHKISFTRATRYQAKSMFERMYQDSKTTMGELQKLGTEFADAIPEAGLSPADIQSFLIAHKHHPNEAVRGVAAWVQDTQERAGHAHRAT